MAANLTFDYSAEADVLCIAKCPTYRGQDTEDIDDLVIARRHPETGAIEYLEILFAAKRIISREPLRLKIPVAPGRICGELAAPEFDALVQPGCPWLTIPPDAAIVELYIPGYDGMPMPATASASASAPAPDAAMV